MGLSDGRKSFLIGLAVLIQYRSVTDSQPPSQPARHVAVAITLYAKASSVKMKVHDSLKTCHYRVLTKSSADADKPTQRVRRPVNVIKHGTFCMLGMVSY